MKKVLISASLVLGSFAASFAQTSAGAIAIGGTVGLSTSSGKTKSTTNGTTVSNDGPKTTNFSFVPNVSYFLSDKFALGLGIGYSGGSSTQTYNTGTTTYQLKSSGGSFIVNPYAKYFISLGEKTSFFLKGDVSFSFGNRKSQSYDGATNTVRDNDPVKNTTIGIGVLPGIIFFPTEKIGVEFALGSPYNYLLGFASSTDKNKFGNTETKDTQNTFSFLNLNTIGVGVSVYYFIK